MTSSQNGNLCCFLCLNSTVGPKSSLIFFTIIQAFIKKIFVVGDNTYCNQWPCLKVACALKNTTTVIERRFYNRIYFYNLFYILVYDTLTNFLIYGIKYSVTHCVSQHMQPWLLYVCLYGYLYFNASNLFAKVSQPIPVQRLGRTYIMKTLCVCVCVCVCIRACINLGGLCNETLGISDCVTLIGCLVNDELERMWKEVVVA